MRPLLLGGLVLRMSFFHASCSRSYLISFATERNGIHFYMSEGRASGPVKEYVLAMSLKSRCVGLELS